jgi:hypothetical protein
MLTACGCDCKDCKEYKQSCDGCAEIKGRVFWAPYVGGEVCPIYGCSDGKGFAHCGECDALPCKIYFDTRDPSMTQEEHEASIHERAERLRGM